MMGNPEGAAKARAKYLEKYNAKQRREIARKAGLKSPRTAGFDKDPARASEAGKKGALIRKQRERPMQVDGISTMV